jgi:hypothetical protein
MSDPTPATKIVIVSGQEFSVPADTDVEAIRSALKGDFPDIATATIQKGTREIAGVTYETVEFVKRAGTKGLGAGDLAQLLRLVPPTAPPASNTPSFLARQFLAGQLTGQQAVDGGLPLVAELDRVDSSYQTRGKEETLCKQLDALSPVAAPSAPSGW